LSVVWRWEKREGIAKQVISMNSSSSSSSRNHARLDARYSHSALSFFLFFSFSSSEFCCHGTHDDDDPREEQDEFPIYCFG
jgi:hypothetical protein